MKKPIVISALLTGVLCFSAMAENWAHWRGPSYNGSTTEKNLPDNWKKEEAKWTLDLPGPGAATPVIYGDRVFVSAVDSTVKSVHAVCVDRKSGKILWNNKVSEGSIQRDDRSNFAAPSPVATADQVLFFYSNGTIVSYDHAGKEIWQKSITKEHGDFAFQWTFSSSPTVEGGKLYLQILQRDVPVHGRGRTDGPIESFILCLDPKTGSTQWKVTRPDAAMVESKEAYSTPIPFTHNGRKEILIAGGDCLTGHDPETGKELWRWGTYNPKKIGHWRLVPSPVAGNGVILISAPKGDPVYAIKAGGNGAQEDSAIAWKSDQKREISTDVPTPSFYDGDFFVLSDVRKNISRVDPATGNAKWVLEIPSRKKFEASPTAADGKIYIMNFAGEVVVVDAKEGKILNTIAMGDEGDDMTRSSIAIASGDLFIRTNKKLYCIGKK